jgi:translation initiation factor IF-3
VRVIVPGGENVGVMKTGDAVKLAREQDLDLVVITEGAKPPVAKILDFNKFLYEENKKNSKTKAKSKKSETKQFRIGAKIDDGAIGIKTKRAREFIEDGHRVKVTVTLRGREKAHPELGMAKIDKFVEALSDVAKPESEIKRTVGSITVTLVKK